MFKIKSAILIRLVNLYILLRLITFQIILINFLFLFCLANINKYKIFFNNITNHII